MAESAGQDILRSEAANEPPAEPPSASVANDSEATQSRLSRDSSEDDNVPSALTEADAQLIEQRPIYTPVSATANSMVDSILAEIAAEGIRPPTAPSQKMVPHPPPLARSRPTSSSLRVRGAAAAQGSAPASADLPLDDIERISSSIIEGAIHDVLHFTKDNLPSRPQTTHGDADLSRRPMTADVLKASDIIMDDILADALAYGMKAQAENMAQLQPSNPASRPQTVPDAIEQSRRPQTADVLQTTDTVMSDILSDALAFRVDSPAVTQSEAKDIVQAIVKLWKLPGRWLHTTRNFKRNVVIPRQAMSFEQHASSPPAEIECVLSCPTQTQPVPDATASVYFYLTPTEQGDVRVTYRLEGQNLYRSSRKPMREKWLLQLLQRKRAIARAGRGVRI